ncbi:hypothetical protein [Nocardia sp. Marseille-Q1738]
MAHQGRFLVHLPRPDGSADFLHIIKKSEATLQTAVDSMGPGDPGTKASVHLIGPGHDAGDPAGTDDPFDQAVPGGENIGRGAIANGYKGRHHAVKIWRRDLDSGDRIAGSAVDDAAMIGPRALNTLRHTITTLEDQLSVPGKLTKAQETIMRGHIDSALETTHHVVLRARQESEDNAFRIDQNMPKKVKIRKVQDGRIFETTDDSLPNGSAMYDMEQAIGNASHPGPMPDGAKFVRMRDGHGSNGERFVHMRDDHGSNGQRFVHMRDDHGSNGQRFVHMRDDHGPNGERFVHMRDDHGPNGERFVHTLSPGVGMPMQGPVSGGQYSGGGDGSSAMSALMPLIQAVSSLMQKPQQGD